MSEQSLEILHSIARHLDETRDLLEQAMARGLTLERSLHNHEYDVADLRWDMAKAQLGPADSAELAMNRMGRRAELVAEQILDSRRTALQVQDSLVSADVALRFVDHTIGALAEGRGPAAPAEGVGVLAARATRLHELVQLAIPMAERTAPELTAAEQARDRGVLPSRAASRSTGSGQRTAASSIPSSGSPTPERAHETA